MATRSTPRIASGARLSSPEPDLPRDEPASAASGTADPKASDGIVRVLWLSDMLEPKQNSFGVLRLAMALAVLVSHCVFLMTGDMTSEPLYAWTGYTLGQHGVQVFFFLSGILVAQSLMKSESVRDYATARALRILPALIVCVLLTALVIGPWLSTIGAMAYLKHSAVAAYIAKTIALVTGSAPLPGLFESAPGAAKGVVNSSLWTLKYEVLCYVALAAVGWIAIRTRAYFEIAAAAIVGWIGLVLYKPTGLGAGTSALEVFRYFLLFFGTGVVAYVLRRRIPIHGLIVLPLLAMAVAAIGTRWATPAMAVGLGYTALWLATFRFGGLRSFTNGSDYSYGTYIYSMPISQTLLQLLPDMNLFTLVFMTVGFSIMLSFISWELIERPALALRHRLSPRRPSENETPVAATTKEVLLARPSSIDSTAAAGDSFVSALDAARRSVDVTTAEIVGETPAERLTVAHEADGRPAAPAAAEPGQARPWRPLASGLRLKVATEAAASHPARSAKRGSRSAEAVAPPLPAPELPKSRLNLALKRRVAAPVPTAATTVPAPANESSAVVVADMPDEPRISKPRPVWRPFDTSPV